MFALHGSFFSSWEIDDAGISYAYARSLAAGEGLVAQTGNEPVEGVTNLLWVGLLAVLLPVVDTPGLAARALSYGLVAAGFLALASGARWWFPRRWRLVAAAGLSTTALVTGFAAWTLSGLENGLYACLVAVFLLAVTRARDTPRDGAAVAGIWILLLATRPEAAPLIVVPALVWAAHHTRRSRAPLALTAAAGLFALTAFRVLYFGDVVPNTYYAKGGPGWRLLAEVSWTPASGLLFGLAGALGLLVVVRLTGSWAGRARWLRERSPRQLGFLALWLTLLVCYLVFETLPTDWMGEGRFATPLFLLGPIALLGLVRRRAVLLGVASLALIAGAAGYSVIHTPAFADVPASALRVGRRAVPTAVRAGGAAGPDGGDDHSPAGHRRRPLAGSLCRDGPGGSHRSTNRQDAQGAGPREASTTTCSRSGDPISSGRTASGAS